MKNPRTQAWLTRPEGLATRLRAARGALTLRQLGDRLGWPSSKVSRFETGQQIPTDADVRGWATATGATPDDLDGMLHELDGVLAMRSTFRRRLKTSQAQAQNSFNELERTTAFIRTYHIGVVPALLQTPGYAREVIKQVERAYDAGKDIAEAVAARMSRQDHLRDEGKRFEFLFAEAALRNVPGRYDVMPAQLDRLISATDLPNVRLGIIPQLKPLAWLPGPSTIDLYDDDDGIIEGFVDNQEYHGENVAFLHRLMDLMWGDAVEGESARALILSAKADLGRVATDSQA